MTKPDSIPKEEFYLTEDHIKLLKHANVQWQNCETGAPEIDPKRPYGNSYVAMDVAEILGWEVPEDDELTVTQCDEAYRIHRETEPALQIVLDNLSIESRIYTRKGYMAWKQATDAHD